MYYSQYSVNQLEIYSSKRTNLNKLSNLKQLKILELWNCRKLEDISGLVNLNLEEIEISACKKIKDFSPILMLKHLKVLKIFNSSKDQTVQLEKMAERLSSKIDFKFL